MNTKTTTKREPRQKSAQPKSYTSTEDVYVNGEYTKAGGVFTTDDPAGDNWTEVEPKEVAAIVAATERVPEDANLDAAEKAALQAVAIIKHVNIVGLDKPALITAIKAAYEPAL